MSEENNYEFTSPDFSEVDGLSLPEPEDLISEDVSIEEIVEEKKVTEEVDENTITSVQAKSTLNPSVVSNEDNVIGSGSAGRKAPSKEPKVKETIAIHSTKNVTWEGVGKVYRGYNIVTEAASVKWLTRGHIRLATPEEVAKDFGK
jgi:DNA-binding protein H-NS